MRNIILWPWQLPDGPELRPVAVANPAIETLWVPHAASPQEPHAEVTYVDLILRVIESVPDAAAAILSPRAAQGSGKIVIDRFAPEDVDQSDPRLIRMRDGHGIRLPSISHLRRVRLDAAGALVMVGEVILPDTTQYEIFGKEDPSVTWLDGTPWLSYVGVSDWGVTPVLARGKQGPNGWVYERVAEAQGHHDNRDVKILPVRPGGLLWRHDRVNTQPWGPKRMTWATSPDEGKSWSSSRPLMAGRHAWERMHVGSGAVPFPCAAPDGRPALASYYHGVHPEAGAVAGCYQTGLAYFDAEAPDRELARLPEPVLTAWANDAFERERRAVCPLDEPTFQARHGLFVIPRVVFTTGHARVGQDQWLFSGVNDICIERTVLR
ncbi:MAG: glycosidase related protein [Cyanobacteria bacterium RYN_339]|nr:glycosidase related protein [Cyanobacteria bacterium RYN_339]